MTDRRATPANSRVAHVSLRGRVAAPRYVEGEWRRVTTPLTDLLDAPWGRRDRQLLMGARVRMMEQVAGHAFVQAEADGYVGYVPLVALGADLAVTHWVAAPASHLYPTASIKTRELAALSCGARLAIVPGTADMAETADGAYIVRRHVRAIGKWAEDPVTIAEGFLGTPYLWGGNSRAGIDCSGLVQIAHHACGIACPGDSDQQADALGTALSEDAVLQRGDLLFWKGHVAIVADANRIIHATGHAMQVTYEDLPSAIARIAAQGQKVLVRRRVTLP